MVRARVSDLLTIVSGDSRVARAIDQQPRDGLLQDVELKKAVDLARGDSYAGRALRSALERRFGPGAADRPDAKEKLERWLAVEQAVSSIRIPRLRVLLDKLCKTPEFETRMVGTPGYDKLTQWLADELKSYGIAPFGDTVNGERTYFDGFSWEQRFGARAMTHSRNVVGILRGNGPEPRKAVMLCAHADSISAAERQWYTETTGRTFPAYEGANDNAAAVAAVLEAARAAGEHGAFPDDVIIFFPSAEEEGLKGTEAFCMQPPIPLGQLIGTINLEMIGKNATEDILVYGETTAEATARDPLYKRAFKVANGANITVKPGLENDHGEGWCGRTDGLVIDLAGVDAISIHGGANPGEYHTPEDTVDRLNFQKVQTVSRLMFRILADLAEDSAPAEHFENPQPDINPYPGRVIA